MCLFCYSFFSVTLGAVLFLVVQTILLFAWIVTYFKNKSLLKKGTTGEANSFEEPYRDYDPYLTNIFGKRRKQQMVDNNSLNSLDLAQRKLILTHLEDKKKRNCV